MLYVIIYKLDLRNVEIKTINFVYDSIHIVILSYCNRRDKSGCFLPLITGMTQTFYLFILRDCGANSQREDKLLHVF